MSLVIDSIPPASLMGVPIKNISNSNRTRDLLLSKVSSFKPSMTSYLESFKNQSTSIVGDGLAISSRQTRLMKRGIQRPKRDERLKRRIMRRSKQFGVSPEEVESVNFVVPKRNDLTKQNPSRKSLSKISRTTEETERVQSPSIRSGKGSKYLRNLEGYMNGFKVSLTPEELKNNKRMLRSRNRSETNIQKTSIDARRAEVDAMFSNSARGRSNSSRLRGEVKPQKSTLKKYKFGRKSLSNSGYGKNRRVSNYSRKSSGASRPTGEVKISNLRDLSQNYTSGSDEGSEIGYRFDENLRSDEQNHVARNDDTSSFFVADTPILKEVDSTEDTNKSSSKKTSLLPFSSADNSLDSPESGFSADTSAGCGANPEMRRFEEVSSSISLTSNLRSPHKNKRANKPSKSKPVQSEKHDELVLETPGLGKNRDEVKSSGNGRKDGDIRSIKTTASNFTTFTQDTATMLDFESGNVTSNFDEQITPSNRVSVVSKERNNASVTVDSLVEDAVQENLEKSFSIVEYESPASKKRKEQERMYKYIRDGKERVIDPKAQKVPTPHVRRSKRIKWRPLSYWKGERVIYQSNVGDDIDILGACKTTLCNSPQTPILPANRQRTKKRKSTLGNRSIAPFKLPVELELAEAEGDYEFYDAQTSQKKRIRFQKEAYLNKRNWKKFYPSEIENFIDIIQEFPPIALTEKEARENPIEVFPEFASEDGTISIGKMKIPPRTQKLIEDTGDCEYRIAIESCQPNSLVFRLQGSDQIAQANTVIEIPRDTRFGFENMSQQYEAYMSYQIVGEGYE